MLIGHFLCAKLRQTHTHTIPSLEELSAQRGEGKQIRKETIRTQRDGDKHRNLKK